MIPNDRPTSWQASSWAAPWLAVLVGLVTFVIYWPATGYDFVALDDNVYVTQNPDVRAGITVEGLRWVPTAVVGGNWHPLTVLSHMVDCHVFGADNAGGHHATSIVIHSFNAALACVVWWRISGQIGPSLLVAALFAWHPLRVESVAWVAERKDVLSGCFALLAIWAYTHYTRQPSWQRMAVVAAMLTLGLMSKPMVVTIPAVLLVLDVWPLRRMGATDESATFQPATVRRLIIEKWPLFAIALIFAAITLATQSAQGVRSLSDVSLTLRAMNASTACVAYVGQFVWPVDLAVFYPFPRHGISLGDFLISVLALLFVTVVALGSWRRRPYLAVGWGWFLIMLLPVIGLVQVGGQARADRYTYLPSIGLAVIFAWAINEVLTAWPRLVAPVTLFCAVGLALVSWTTRSQLATWRDSQTLFRHATEVTNNNFLAYAGLGNLHADRGEHQQALAMFEQALNAMPGFGVALYGKADALSALNRPAEAVEFYQRSIEAGLDGVQLRLRYAAALETVSQPNAARDQLEAALRFSPDSTIARDALDRLIQRTPQ